MYSSLLLFLLPCCWCGARPPLPPVAMAMTKAASDDANAADGRSPALPRRLSGLRPGDSDPPLVVMPPLPPLPPPFASTVDIDELLTCRRGPLLPGPFTLRGPELLLL
jgi:hypothetical protein